MGWDGDGLMGATVVFLMLTNKLRRHQLHKKRTASTEDLTWDDKRPNDIGEAHDCRDVRELV